MFFASIAAAQFPISVLWDAFRFADTIKGFENRAHKTTPSKNVARRLSSVMLPTYHCFCCLYTFSAALSCFLDKLALSSITCCNAASPFFSQLPSLHSKYPLTLLSLPFDVSPAFFCFVDYVAPFPAAFLSSASPNFIYSCR